MRSLGWGAAALALEPQSLLDMPRRPSRNYVWSHAHPDWKPDRWRQTFDQLRRAGIQGILVEGGAPAVEPVFAPAAEFGIEVHGWIWTLNHPHAPELRTQHPERFSVNRLGESCATRPPYVDYYRWLCPSRPENRAYIVAQMDHLAQYSELASVHLDYVRHPDVILPIALQPKYGLVQDREYPAFDYCYCEVCRSRFQDLHGRDPLDLDDPTADADWRAYRWDSVSELVREIGEAVHARGKKLSAAVFPSPAIARTLVRQAWDTWPLDLVFPMQYHNFYDEDLHWIADCVRAGRAATTARLYSGLFVPALDARQLRKAIGLVLRAGADGVCLFELGSLQPEHWAVLTAVLGT
ncbi:MAG: family 10 glycosylhydrolase [Bacteroidia bacterium]